MSAHQRRQAASEIFDRSGAVPLPCWRDRIADTGSVLANIAGLGASLPMPAELPRGDGHPVLVVPGLLSSDSLIRHFRHVLTALGCRHQLGPHIGVLAYPRTTAGRDGKPLRANGEPRRP